jgi:glucose-1-phosphate cytidylyltransferase
MSGIEKFVAIILCGGQGTRLREKTEELPKPMVHIGGRPILWHIMSHYALFGIERFVLPLGYLGDKIRSYFLNYKGYSSDFTLTMGEASSLQFYSQESAVNWRVTCAETGLDAMTGSRIARVRKYIDSEYFFVTYGDGLANVDISGLLAYHISHGKIGTVTGVHAPSRFGKITLGSDSQNVETFSEKPMEDTSRDYINGGFFIFSQKFFDYLSTDKSCVLEQTPLERLSRDGQLVMYPHNGFWRCMDTYRDWVVLDEMANQSQCPWHMK